MHNAKEDLAKASMKGSIIIQQHHCRHQPLACPLSQTTRAPCRVLARTKCRQGSWWHQPSKFRCNAVAEAEVEAAEKETETDDLDIEELNNQDFRAAFDDLLQKTKTRFDVGDKVKGIVER